MDVKINRGQVAIWVVLGVILVASVIIFFSIGRIPKIIKPSEAESVFDIQSPLDVCVSALVLEAVDKILPQGGFIEPKNSVRFDEKEVEYWCYTNLYFESCVQQHPMPRKEVKNEILNYINEPIGTCFEEVENSIREMSGKINYESDYSVSIDWWPDTIQVKIKRDASVEKQGETRRYSEFRIEVKSPAYNLVEVAEEIARQEGHPERCYFENRGYSLIYNRFNIELYNQYNDGTKLFIINDKKSEKSMKVATRSCVLKQGV